MLDLPFNVDLREGRADLVPAFLVLRLTCQYRLGWISLNLCRVFRLCIRFNPEIAPPCRVTFIVAVILAVAVGGEKIGVYHWTTGLLTIVLGERKPMVLEEAERRSVPRLHLEV